MVVLSGAGVSVESGLQTFRDSGGLAGSSMTYTRWLHRRPGPAIPKWYRNFTTSAENSYSPVKPNDAHRYLARLPRECGGSNNNPNIDDLHERAGSNKVMHLHGELLKARSTLDENLVYDIKGWEFKLGAKCERGSQLRPHVVWFGEMVPMIEPAAELSSPGRPSNSGGNLIGGLSSGRTGSPRITRHPVILIDPDDVPTSGLPNVYHIKQPATSGVRLLLSEIWV
ncbi:MAG: Sir2 family NAD-dependent protein deacetylase [Owenweeksia sp.]|nr:Sir2 family NAD-dependent protein deacetylase [Owenweeksia sp.]